MNKTRTTIEYGMIHVLTTTVITTIFLSILAL